LANPHRGQFGRDWGDLEHAGKTNPGHQPPRAEFANGIRCCRNPVLQGKLVAEGGKLSLLDAGFAWIDPKPRVEAAATPDSDGGD
jgi:hypothetical protein